MAVRGRVTPLCLQACPPPPVLGPTTCPKITLPLPKLHLTHKDNLLQMRGVAVIRNNTKITIARAPASRRRRTLLLQPELLAAAVRGTRMVIVPAVLLVLAVSVHHHTLPTLSVDEVVKQPQQETTF